MVHIQHRDGSTSILGLTHDCDPASAADVAFVAHSRDDVGRLIRAVRGQAALSAEDVQRIAVQCDQASSGPWRAFLEARRIWAELRGNRAGLQRDGGSVREPVRPEAPLLLARATARGDDHLAYLSSSSCQRRSCTRRHARNQSFLVMCVPRSHIASQFSMAAA